MKRILRHAIEWNAQVNQGKLFLDFGSGDRKTIALNNAGELMAIGRLLEESPVYSNGIVIRTGWEE